MKLFTYTPDLILENQHVRLEPLTLEHIPALTQIASRHPTLLQYSPSKFGTEASLIEYVQNNIAMRDKGLKYPWAIYDKTMDTYAGSTSYLNNSQKDGRLEIGSTWLDKAHQRTGLNRACKYLLLSYAFETLGWERVELKTDSRNTQSMTAIEKIGAQYEGKLRSHTLMSDGYRRDTVYYSILKTEWPSVKSNIFGDYRKRWMLIII